MATGDTALAEGMNLVPGTGQAKDLDTYDNETRDYIAKFFRRVWSGVRDKTTAAQVRTALGLGSAATYDQNQSATPYTIVRRWGNGSVTGPDPTSRSEYATKAYVDGSSGVDNTARSLAEQARSLAEQARSLAAQARNGEMLPEVYSRTLGGYYRSLYVGADGLLGWVSSSRKFKKNIRPATVDPASVLSLQLVEFLYKVEIDTARIGELQHGLIAEDVHDAGLTWLVDYGTSGEPEGIRYDRLALALLPVVQHLDARLTALETAHGTPAQ